MSALEAALESQIRGWDTTYPGGPAPAGILADRAGAGAAGGLGFALFALGPAVNRCRPRLHETCPRRSHRRRRPRHHRRRPLDRQSLRGKVPTAVVALAAGAGRPCLVLAGQVRLPVRDQATASSLGVSGWHAVTDLTPLAAALADPAGALATLAAAVARQWSTPATG